MQILQTFTNRLIQLAFSQTYLNDSDSKIIFLHPFSVSQDDDQSIQILLSNIAWFPEKGISQTGTICYMTERISHILSEHENMINNNYNSCNSILKITRESEQI